jgi:CTP synthase (UTP-ammonia lyase)
MVLYMTISIALVGDYNDKITAHTAIPHALKLASSALDSSVTWKWVSTTDILNPAIDLSEFSGIWVVPGSPYANMNAVLEAIKFVRETKRPFLGTCGGCQHALIEYARNACNIYEADHAETNPKGKALIVTPLSCSLVEKEDQVVFAPDSRLSKILGEGPIYEGYRCNYGLNPKWRSQLETAGLRFTGFNTYGNTCAFELPNHPFFIGTLFQPERSALKNEQYHPLILAFLEAQKLG